MLLFLALILAGLVYGFLPQPIPVDLGVVERGRLEVTVNEDGKTRIKDRFIVTAPVGGRMERVTLKPGANLSDLPTRALTHIEPSEPILLDARARGEAIASEKGAKAALEEARERLDEASKKEGNARAEYERVRRAGLGGGTSRQEVDDAEFKLRSAEHDLSAKRFALKVSEYRLEQARAVLRPFDSPGEKLTVPVLSPISSGRVLRVFQESATVVTPGMQILEVGDLSELEAEIDVLTTDAVKIRKGDPAYLEHWGGKERIVGEVLLTEPSGFTKISALGVEEQRVNVIIKFKVPGDYQGQVRDGYRVEARIVIWKEDNVLMVPSGALFRHEGKHSVYVKEGDRAVLRPVKVDNNNGREAQVLDGLKEGEQVVLHPGDKIKPGVSIVSRKEQ
jgi:HlyD family secretion protein